MITIREMLEREGISFADRELRWDNAELNAYQEELDQYGNQPDIRIYGIELRSGEESSYTNYTLIDHHNEYADRPAALAQVAEILNIPLSRYEELVAANDSHYIPGMQALGATLEEIREIRLRDRAAQCVTARDEELAEKAIAGQRCLAGDLQVVYSETPRFSPICDRLYPYKKLLVYTNTEWMYYGEAICQVIALFPGEKASGILYHGGGANGFTGIASGSRTKEHIRQMIEQIIHTITH